MRYDIIDTQLGDYYEENITLEDARQTAIRFAERSILEQGNDEEFRQSYSELLRQIEQDTSFEGVAASLECFDYELVEHEE